MRADVPAEKRHQPGGARGTRRRELLRPEGTRASEHLSRHRVDKPLGQGEQVVGQLGRLAEGLAQISGVQRQIGNREQQRAAQRNLALRGLARGIEIGGG